MKGRGNYQQKLSSVTMRRVILALTSSYETLYYGLRFGDIIKNSQKSRRAVSKCLTFLTEYGKVERKVGYCSLQQREFPKTPFYRWVGQPPSAPRDLGPKRVVPFELPPEVVAEETTARALRQARTERYSV